MPNADGRCSVKEKSDPGSALDSSDEAAAHQLHLAAGNREPEPRAALSRFRRSPAGTARRCGPGSRAGMPGPGVLHLEAPAARSPRSISAQRHDARFCELDGVAEQVDEHLPQLARIADDASMRPPVESLDAQREVLFLTERLEHDGELVDAAPADRTAARVTSIRPASIFDKSRISLMRCSRWLELPAIVWTASRWNASRASRRRRMSAVAEDGVERRPDLVAHVREECRLRAIRASRPPLRPAAGCRLRPASAPLDAASSAVRRL